QCYRDLRDLHSFPTRRSSDLEQKSQFLRPGRFFGGGCLAGRPGQPGQLEAKKPVLLLFLFPSGKELERYQVLHNQPGLESVKKRSEEHTSELQSRENLVCRLL